MERGHCCDASCWELGLSAHHLPLEEICGPQLHLFTAHLFHLDKHSHMHAYVCVLGSLLVALNLKSVSNLPHQSALCGAHTSLYMRSDTANKRGAVKQMHMCFMVTHTRPPAHVVFNRQTSLASILNDLFPRGEGTGCLVIRTCG